MHNSTTFSSLSSYYNIDKLISLEDLIIQNEEISLHDHSLYFDEIFAISSELDQFYNGELLTLTDI